MGSSCIPPAPHHTWAPHAYPLPPTIHGLLMHTPCPPPYVGSSCIPPAPHHTWAPHAYPLPPTIRGLLMHTPCPPPIVCAQWTRECRGDCTGTLRVIAQVLRRAQVCTPPSPPPPPPPPLFRDQSCCHVT